MPSKRNSCRMKYEPAAHLVRAGSRICQRFISGVALTEGRQCERCESRPNSGADNRSRPCLQAHWRPAPLQAKRDLAQTAAARVAVLFAPGRANCRPAAK